MACMPMRDTWKRSQGSGPPWARRTMIIEALSTAIVLKTPFRQIQRRLPYCAPHMSASLQAYPKSTVLSRSYKTLPTRVATSAHACCVATASRKTLKEMPSTMMSARSRAWRQ